jgi:hypothetical protein
MPTLRIFASLVLFHFHSLEVQEWQVLDYIAANQSLFRPKMTHYHACQENASYTTQGRPETTISCIRTIRVQKKWNSPSLSKEPLPALNFSDQSL